MWCGNHRDESTGIEFVWFCWGCCAYSLQRTWFAPSGGLFQHEHLQHCQWHFWRGLFCKNWQIICWVVMLTMVAQCQGKILFFLAHGILSLTCSDLFLHQCFGINLLEVQLNGVICVGLIYFSWSSGDFFAAVFCCELWRRSCSGFFLRIISSL